MFHGVEELRKAGGGKVFWGEVLVEHFSYPDTEDGQERECAAARELAARCRTIEARGEPVSWGSVSREGMWDGVAASQALRDVAVALCAKYGINALCDPGYVANTIHREQVAEAPYFAVEGGIYPSRPAAVRGGGAVTDLGLTIDQLCSVSDQPWRGRCGFSGATMLDYAEALGQVDVPAWVKRAAVRLCRSYASNIDWSASVRDMASLIGSACGP